MTYQQAFEAPFRIVENNNKKSESSPPYLIAFNFTREDAVKAANWFMAMAERVDTEATTYSLWDKEKEEAYTVPGFTMFASCWGRSGKLSPPTPETMTYKASKSRDLPF